LARARFGAMFQEAAAAAPRRSARQQEASRHRRRSGGSGSGRRDDDDDDEEPSAGSGSESDGDDGSLAASEVADLLGDDLGDVLDDAEGEGDGGGDRGGGRGRRKAAGAAARGKKSTAKRGGKGADKGDEDDEDDDALSPEQRAALERQAFNEIVMFKQDMGTVTADGKFTPSPHLQEALRGLDFLIKRDAPDDRRYHRQLARAGLHVHKLIPFLQVYSAADDTQTVFLLVRLLTRLTLPFRGDVAAPHEETANLQSCKRAFADKEVLAALARWVAAPLGVAPAERSDGERDAIELFVTLCRNLFRIPDPADDVFLHDRLVEAMQESALLDVLVVMASQVNMDEKHLSYALLLLESVHFLFRGLQPEDLYGERVSHVEESRGDAARAGISRALQQQLDEERQQRAQMLKHAPSRHTFFGGMLLVRSGVSGADARLVRNVFARDTQLPNAALRFGRVMRPKVVESVGRQFFSDVARAAYRSSAEAFVDTAFQELVGFLLPEFETAALGLEEADFALLFSTVAFFLGVHRSRVRALRDAEYRRRKTTTPQPPPPPPPPSSSSSSSLPSAAPPASESAAGSLDSQPGCYDPTPVFCALSEPVASWLFRCMSDRRENKPTQWTTLSGGAALIREVMEALCEMVAHGTERARRDGGVLVQQLLYEEDKLFVLDALLRLYDPAKVQRAYMVSLIHAAYCIGKLYRHVLTAHSRFFVLGRRRKVTRKRKDEEEEEDEDEGDAEEGKEKEGSTGEAKTKEAEEMQAPAAAATTEATAAEARPETGAESEEETKNRTAAADARVDSEPAAAALAQGATAQEPGDPTRGVVAGAASPAKAASPLRPEAAQDRSKDAVAEARPQVEEKKEDDDAAPEADDAATTEVRFVQREHEFRLEAYIQRFANHAVSARRAAPFSHAPSMCAR
jgi:hypothetical protein